MTCRAMAVQCRGVPLLCDAVLFRAETEFYNRRPDLIPAEPQEMYLNASSSFDRPGAMSFLRFRGRTGQSASFIVVAVTKRSLLTLAVSTGQKKTKVDKFWHILTGYISTKPQPNLCGCERCDMRDFTVTRTVLAPRYRRGYGG